MNRAKKNLCLLLGLVLCLGMFGGALAEGTKSFSDAQTAGREFHYDAKFSWYDSGLVTDETANDAIKAMLDALSFEGRMAVNLEDESMYSSSAMLLSGNEALTFDQVVQDGVVYLQSPMLGEGIALRPEDVNLYLQKVGAYLDSQTPEGTEPTNYEDMLGSMMPEFNPVQSTTFFDPDDEMTPEEANAAMIEAMGLDAETQATLEWLEKKLEQGEEFEGDIESVFGTKATHAIVHTMTRDDLVEFFEVLRPHLEKNETYFGWFLSIYNATTLPEEDPMTLDELMAEVPAAFDEIINTLQEIPEDVTFSISECYDDDEALVLTQIELNMPAEDETDEALRVYGEIEPDGTPLYFEVVEGEGGMALTVVSKGAEDAPDKGFTATLTLVEAGEVTTEIILQTTSIESETPDGRVWDGGMKLAVVVGGQEMGMNITANEVDAYSEEDISCALNITASLVSDALEIPVVGMTVNAYTTEPTGAPFEVDDSFVDVANLDDAAFAEHMTTMTAASLQTLFTVLSELPQEVYNALVPQPETEIDLTEYPAPEAEATEAAN